MYRSIVTTIMKQYFFLVCSVINELAIPIKIFLQLDEAIKWGRRRATLSQKNGYDTQYHLYKQLIARTSELEFVMKLPPFKE